MSAPSTDTAAVRGYLLEVETPDALLAAAETVRDAGYTSWDTFSPFPVHGMDRAMGIRPTRLPLFVFGGGATGAILGWALQHWTNAVDYPFLISGKPLSWLPAQIPVIFELTILLAAFGAFVGMLAMNKLPRFVHPLFSSARFARATNDRFFLAIEADDPKFDETGTRELLAGLGEVEEVTDE